MSKKLRIGIDIDGVLTDLERWQLDYGSKFYYEHYGKTIADPQAYETANMFDVSKDIDNQYWIECYKDYAINTTPRAFASEIINKLKQEGHEIYIITARGSSLSHSSLIMTREENEQEAIAWLSKNNIDYDKLILSPEDKLEICMQNNIDLMIEDRVANINNVSTKIPVICVDTNYNKECNSNNIYRCYSWYDIYAKINSILNN
jgi:uncharacterized HAD superfamily protein